MTMDELLEADAAREILIEEPQRRELRGLRGLKGLKGGGRRGTA